MFVYEKMSIYFSEGRMKPIRLSMCMRCERALLTQEIMRRKDAQCNSMESPQAILNLQTNSVIHMQCSL